MRATNKKWRSTPSVAERLGSNKDKLVSEFVSCLRSEIPALSGRSDSFVADTLPALIDQMAQRFQEPSKPGPLKLIEDIGENHAQSRLSITGYSLVQVLTEYHLLRRVLVDFLLSSGDFSHEERRILNDAIDTCVTHSGQAYLNAWNKQNQLTVDRLTTEKLVRERFVHALSHDLRNPVAAIDMNAKQALKFVDKDSLARKPLNRILSNVGRIEKMIQSVLTVGQAESGLLPITPVRTDIQALLEQTLNELATESHDRFILSCPAIMANIDPLAVRRAVENLITNAVKYGRADSPIRLSVADAGDTFTLSVFNEGTPMTAQTKEYLFKPFRRGDSPSQKNNVGWGIGLFLVKSVIDAHYGSVDIESSEQIRGTKVTIRLPKSSPHS